MTSPNNAPIETKVQAATVGSALSAIIVWLLDAYAFGDIPLVIQAAIGVLVVAIVTFVSGYLAPHTPRHSAVSSVESDGNPRL